MSLPSEIPVLIVGAGPVGLTAAIKLASLGVLVAIVDSSSSNKNGSRASTVHARTLEVLDTIDLAVPLVAAGLPSNGPIFFGKMDKLIEFNISQLRDVTKYPMSLHIPQDEVERIFRDKLASEGIQVVENQTVVNVREGDVDRGLEVIFEDGSIVRTRYVIGADGSHSTIRRLAGIEFRDPTTEILYDDRAPPALQMILADAFLKEPLPACIPRKRLSLHLDNFLVFIPHPFRGKSQDMTSFWRIGYGIGVGGPQAPRNPSLDYLQQQMDERNPFGTKITIESAFNSSTYRVRSAVASTYFRKMDGGNILLVGDAAHVHSPVGGQGMNLGICDAVMLGNAVHSHIKETDSGLGEKGDASLRAYATSRRKTAIRVIGFAKFLTTLINASTGWRRVVRNMTFRIIRHLPYMSRLSAWMISGLANRAD